MKHNVHHLALACLAGLALPVLAQTAAPVALIRFITNTATAQGGMVEAFAYSEKSGDAALDGVSVNAGVAHVTGKIGAEKGSTWAGVALRTTLGAGDKTLDFADKGNLSLKLASTTATQLRVRVLGSDKAVRDNGCYPIFEQKVTPELTEYTIPLTAFAPESYCAALGKPIATVARAVAAIEVSDPTVAPKARKVEFDVSSIELRP